MDHADRHPYFKASFSSEIDGFRNISSYSAAFPKASRSHAQGPHIICCPDEEDGRKDDRSLLCCMMIASLKDQFSPPEIFFCILQYLIDVRDHFFVFLHDRFGNV